MQSRARGASASSTEQGCRRSSLGIKVRAVSTCLMFVRWMLAALVYWVQTSKRNHSSTYPPQASRFFAMVLTRVRVRAFISGPARSIPCAREGATLRDTACCGQSVTRMLDDAVRTLRQIAFCTPFCPPWCLASYCAYVIYISNRTCMDTVLSSVATLVSTSKGCQGMIFPGVRLCGKGVHNHKKRGRGAEICCLQRKCSAEGVRSLRARKRGRLEFCIELYSTNSCFYPNPSAVAGQNTDPYIPFNVREPCMCELKVLYSTLGGSKERNGVPIAFSSCPL